MSTCTRPLLRYHGAKWRLAPWIIQHFPEHRRYTEAYGNDYCNAACRRAATKGRKQDATQIG